MSYNEIDIIRDLKMPKTYRLFYKGVRQMVHDQFTNRQIKEFYSQYDMGYGDILITGFGFGILANWLASKPEVKSVTVIELEKDIYDIFLMNNTLHEKVNVIIADASTYKTDKHYDCLFLDHYESNINEWVFRDMRRIVKNIPNHDLFWAWSLEFKIAEVAYGLDAHNLYNAYLHNNYVDFYEKYDYFKGTICGIRTLPDLSQEKINEYVYTYYDKLGYSSSL
jgi:hypothetical protein